MASGALIVVSAVLVLSSVAGCFSEGDWFFVRIENDGASTTGFNVKVLDPDGATRYVSGIRLAAGEAGSVKADPAGWADVRVVVQTSTGITGSYELSPELTCRNCMLRVEYDGAQLQFRF